MLPTDAIEQKPTPVMAPILCAALVGLLFLATIRSGHIWHDDFAMYITHARNIAHGKGYAESGYIYNPHLPVIGPRAYPPVLPLLLSPLCRLPGDDLWPMKAMMVGFWAMTMAVVPILFAGVLPPGWAIGGTALLGLNPFFWTMKDAVVSDLPFLFFFLLSLLLMGSLVRQGQSLALPLAAVSGVLMYLAYGTRTIGIVTVPILGIGSLLAHRRVTRNVLVALGVFALLACLQHAILPGGGSSYLDQFEMSPASLLRNLTEYTFQASRLLEDGHGSALRKVFFSMMGVLAVVGYVHRARAAGLSVVELAPLFCGLIVMMWPSRGGLRLLIPIVPFFILYALAGAHTLAARLGPGARRAVLALLLVCAGLIYTDRYAHTDFGPIREGVTSQASLQLLEHIRNDTDRAAVLAFSKPRYLALATGRRAAACHAPPDDRDLWRYLREIHASYFIVGPDFLGPLEQELRRFASEHPTELKTDFENADFTMYRIVSSPI